MLAYITVIFQIFPCLLSKNFRPTLLLFELSKSWLVLKKNHGSSFLLVVDLMVVTFSSVQLLSRVQLFAIPWITAHQASLSITNSWSLHKLKFIQSVMPSNHLILCRPLLLLLPIPPSIRVFSNELTLHLRWPKYWSSVSASVLPTNTQDWSPLGWTG